MAAAGMRIEAIPAFQDNYIWLLRQGGDAVVVDPGAASPVLHRLAQRREGSHKLKMHKATVAAG